MLLNRGRPSIGGAAGAKARADKDAVDGAKVEEQSREKWQADLGNLLRNAEKRFADIGWLTSPGGREEIWAHKGERASKAWHGWRRLTVTMTI